MNKLLINTKSEEETMRFAEKFATFLSKGNVLLLHGDLGAGKTHFVKGLVKGFGSNATVTSPTFTLLNIYEDGKFPIYHFDMYRLNSLEEAQEMGFAEYFDVTSLNGVSIVEWPENVKGLINCPHINIEIKKMGENERQILIGGGE